MTRPSFLQRAEDLYLNILRVVILAVATLALVGVIFGLGSAGPLLKPAPSASNQPPPSLQASTLGDFVSEKKAEGTPVGEPSSTSGESPADTITSSTQVRDAAKNLQAYTRAHDESQASLALWIKLIQANEATVPDAYHPAYEANLFSLTKQLAISRGAPLTLDNVEALITWHAAKFKSAADTEASENAAARVAAGVRLQLAGYALATFLLLVFAFLFVKIERNLRVVRTLTKVEP